MAGEALVTSTVTSGKSAPGRGSAMAVKLSGSWLE
jgi:hypothetical protein